MLTIASCQFPVSGSIPQNRRWIQKFISKAAAAGADLLHTPEASLPGYAGSDFNDFDAFDWKLLRNETAVLRKEARSHGIGLVLGSTHQLGAGSKPTNCLYILDRLGRLVDRYDKCFCTERDRQHYSAGERLVVRTIKGVKIGFSICYDICFPQHYAAYRLKGVQLMIHSFYNAGDRGPDCLDVLNLRQVPTRCADNLMWAIANNSSRPYSHWGSFVARPDAGIVQQLPKNRPGMLLQAFPANLPPGSWMHCTVPMQVAKGEVFHLGRTSRHPRYLDGRSPP